MCFELAGSINGAFIVENMEPPPAEFRKRSSVEEDLDLLSLRTLTQPRVGHSDPGQLPEGLGVVYLGVIHVVQSSAAVQRRRAPGSGGIVPLLGPQVAHPQRRDHSAYMSAGGGGRDYCATARTKFSISNVHAVSVERDTCPL